MTLAQIKEKLEIVRVNISKREGIAPYSVFNDEDLKLLLEVQPKSVKQLAGLRGFPEKGSRVTNWGQEIVKVFTDIDISTNNTAQMSAFGK